MYAVLRSAEKMMLLFWVMIPVTEVPFSTGVPPDSAR